MLLKFQPQTNKTVKETKDRYGGVSNAILKCFEKASEKWHACGIRPNILAEVVNYTLCVIVQHSGTMLYCTCCKGSCYFRSVWV
jgi:hypothetical protein